MKFATFKFGDFRSLTFSDSHRFYTDEDAKTLEEIPPPHAPYSRKYEFFDPEEYTEVDKHASNVCMNFIVENNFLLYEFMLNSANTVLGIISSKRN